MPIPVICVGNLTIGGSGKTPVTMSLQKLLGDMGIKACIVSRGYRGKIQRPHYVTKNDTFDKVGDEPLMLSKKGAIIVSKNKKEGIIKAYNDGYDIVILDDGFQNSRIKKDLSLVVVDSQILFGNELIFPLGPLREPIQSGLSRADAIVLIDYNPSVINSKINKLKRDYKAQFLDGLVNEKKVSKKKPNRSADNNKEPGKEYMQALLFQTIDSLNNLEKFIMKSEQSRKNFEDLIVESSKVMVKINNEISIRVGQYNKNELANVDSLNKIEEQLRGLREQINNKNNNNNDDLAKEIQVLAKTISLMNKWYNLMSRKEIGLINDHYSKSKLNNEVLKIAKKISSKSNLTIKIGKQAFYKQLEMPLRKAYLYTSKMMTKNMMAMDAKEGISAFLQKRKPVWKNR